MCEKCVSSLYVYLPNLVRVSMLRVYRLYRTRVKPYYYFILYAHPIPEYF